MEYKVPRHMQDIISITGSGSSGNAVILLNKILIDCGFTHNKFIANTNNLKAKITDVFYTHQHQDHLYPTTAKKFVEAGINLNVPQELGNWMSTNKYLKPLLLHKNVNVRNYNTWYTQDTYKFKLTKLTHGKIYSCAIIIKTKVNNKKVKILYATDFNKPSELPKDTDFTHMFIEGNYSSHKIKDILANGDYMTIKRAQLNLNHNSKESAYWYINKHLANPKNFIILHKSSTNYN